MKSVVYIAHMQNKNRNKVPETLKILGRQKKIIIKISFHQDMPLPSLQRTRKASNRLVSVSFDIRRLPIHI